MNPARSTTGPAALAAAEPSLEQLRAELHSVREELEAARREAAAKRDAEDRFLSSLSHELRTPLSAILLWASLLEEQRLDDPEQLREAVDAIKRSAEEQQALVQNLVDTARILSGRLRLDQQATAVEALVGGAVELIEAAAREKSVAVERTMADSDLRVMVDGERLQQALRLLLSNAVKFTPAGGKIRVRAARAGSDAVIEITDTGAGISREQLPHLFDGPNTELRVAARTDSGLGFGLVVARRLVEAHRGTIEATSPGPDQGATFSLRLPALARRSHA